MKFFAYKLKSIVLLFLFINFSSAQTKTDLFDEGENLKISIEGWEPKPLDPVFNPTGNVIQIPNEWIRDIKNRPCYLKTSGRPYPPTEKLVQRVKKAQSLIAEWGLVLEIERYTAPDVKLSKDLDVLQFQRNSFLDSVYELNELFIELATIERDIYSIKNSMETHEDLILKFETIKAILHRGEVVPIAKDYERITENTTKDPTDGTTLRAKKGAIIAYSYYPDFTQTVHLEIGEKSVYELTDEELIAQAFTCENFESILSPFYLEFKKISDNSISEANPYESMLSCETFPELEHCRNIVEDAINPDNDWPLYQVNDAILALDNLNEIKKIKLEEVGPTYKRYVSKLKQKIFPQYKNQIELEGEHLVKIKALIDEESLEYEKLKQKYSDLISRQNKFDNERKTNIIIKDGIMETIKNLDKQIELENEKYNALNLEFEDKEKLILQYEESCEDYRAIPECSETEEETWLELRYIANQEIIIVQEKLIESMNVIENLTHQSSSQWIELNDVEERIDEIVQSLFEISSEISLIRPKIIIDGSYLDIRNKKILTMIESNKKDLETVNGLIKRLN